MNTANTTRLNWIEQLPEVGATLAQGEVAGVVESVKAASDVYAPIAGEVVEINQALVDAPETANSEPYGAGWMCAIKFDQLPADLLSAEEYAALIKE